MELQAFRAPFTTVFAVERCFVVRIPLLKFRAPLLCFLYALPGMAGIPFLFVVLTLVAFQILFPAFSRLLESPLWSGIVSAFAVGFVPDSHIWHCIFLLQFIIFCPTDMFLLIAFRWFKTQSSLGDRYVTYRYKVDFLCIRRIDGKVFDLSSIVSSRWFSPKGIRAAYPIPVLVWR